MTEFNGPALTEYDLKYLQGDDEFWKVKGAAFNVVYSWNKNKGYGVYGEPTERGKMAMESYYEKAKTFT